MKAVGKSLLVGTAVALLASCTTPDTGTAATPVAPATDYRNSRAEVVVLNFFDMYCPHCQTAAAKVNELHQRVQQRGLGSRVEFFGIGWENSPMECDMYRTRFKVPYKIIPDRDKAISSRFGRFRPPLLVALRRTNGAWTEFYRTAELRVDPESILSHITP